ncbi:MAG: aminotransferase class I/II-fold pyridoxal phosphate-dependent enzyme [Treponema sp.]|jgi:histidinol-phosphate aminotransferase|nr:aminotransferase class I/II-fold pyridoxal phosphate-dependent enzyme [Treponema sp.]
MSVYWNSRVKNIAPYIPGEQPKDRKIIKINTNENPYPPSPRVIEAIKNAAGERLRLYPDPECELFREAAAARYGVKPRQVFAGNGSDEILAFAFGAFFESGEKAAQILFPDITYSFYPVYASLWDIPYRTIALADDFSIIINDYKIPSSGGGATSGGVIFPNPNAPTSVALPLDEIMSLAEYLEKQGKVLIVDEAYIAFSGGCDTKSAVRHINAHPNLLTVHTLSKSASLAGLRFGFAIGNEELIDGLRRVRDSFNSYTLDFLALTGAAAAISDSAYYDEINRRVMSTRERTAQALRDLGFTVLPSSANFLFVKPPNISGEELFAALRRRGILVRHFKKERISDFLRVSIGTDEDMDVFLDACREIVNANNSAPLQPAY